MTIKEYIADNIEKTLRHGDGSNPMLIALPYPYTVPSAEGFFQEMYYWDTYFVNKALIALGMVGQAINNLENFKWMIGQYGFIPNGNRLELLNRSQPPLFTLAVMDAWEYLDAEKRAEFVEAVKTEYEFWQTQRRAENGLNHYGCSADDATCLDFILLYEHRVGKKLPRTVEMGRNLVAEAESGWDFTPRFPDGCLNYCAADLNAILYGVEIFLSEQDAENCAKWAAFARSRRERMSALQVEGGAFCDYSLGNKRPSGVLSSAGFFPYFTGASDDVEGYKRLLAALERDHGTVACLSEGEGVFQWAEPNGWPPLIYVCVAAAERLGLKDDAMRISKKYVSMVERIFGETGKLFEKYNVVTGNIGLGENYGTPEMLGWSAGVYLSLKGYMENGTLL